MEGGVQNRRRPASRGIAAALLTCLVFGPAGRAQVAGGPTPGKPVLGRHADGYLEVFRVDAGGTLQHRWQKKSNGDWSAWVSLGQGFCPEIALASNARGELEAFAVSAASPVLLHARRVETNGTDWTGWTYLGGGIRPPLAAAQNAEGRLEVFGLAENSSEVRHLWQTREGWSGWASLGGEVEPGFIVASNRDGRLELFGVEPHTRALIHCRQQSPSAGAGADWSGWASLGGCIRPGFAVGQNALGVLEVFGVNATNGAVERIRQAVPASSGEWTAWENFGGDARDGLAAGQSADGRLEVLAVNRADGMLLHRWEILNNGSDQWSAWASMGRRAEPSPAVGRNEDGNLEVFAVDPDNHATLNHKRQISQASDWLDWATLDQPALPYSSRTWRTDEGLPDNQVQAIAQTRDGYLWVGTRAGLARFDGISFTSFDIRNTPALRNSSITALCADRQGALWSGTEGGGLVRLREGVFTAYGKTDGLAGDVLKVVYEARDGSLWIGTTTGISRYRDGQFINYTRRQGLSSDVVSCIAEDRDGFLWVATGEGLNRLKGAALDAFPMPNGLPNDSVRAILQDRAGRIWIGSNNGMLWYNAYWKSFYAYNTKYGLSDTFVSAICDDREGNLWVGTYSGLNRFREGRFFTELNNEGVPFDRVNALFEDGGGNLWVGSRDGLTRLTPERFLACTKRQGLSHNNVMSVLEDRQGQLWIGTWGGGLNCLHDERVTTYASTNDLAQTLVLALAEAHDGSLWIGADFDGGLARLKNGAFTHYTSKDGLPPAAIRVVHEDRATNLWVGTSQGLYSLRNGSFTNLNPYLAGVAVRAISEDPSGQLWFGTDAGLTRWRSGAFTNFTTADGLPDNRILALYSDRDRNLWLGTRDAGLVRCRNGRFTPYTTRQGLFSDEIFEIIEDNQGWLWMTCSKGVFRVRKRDLDQLDQGVQDTFSSIAYGRNDGLESIQCNGAAKPAAWKARDGRLWFPTAKGVVVIDPATAPVNQRPPPVFIEQVLADRKPLRAPVPVSTINYQLSTTPSLHHSTTPLIQQSINPSIPPPPLPVPLVAPPGRGELEFHYTALDLAAPESARFKYRLEGFDPEWLDAGARRVAYYNNLAPGTYTFRVRACSRDGAWNQEGASLAILLRPHLWQTWWWRGFLGVLAVGAVGGTARYATRRRMQRKLELLQRRHAIERERGRIAKDIHDDLGSSLTRIMMLGERTEEGLARREEIGLHVHKIVGTARASVQAMDEIVWAVNPENDTLEGLVEYLSHYADEFFENSDVRCRLEIPVELPACTLPADIRHDLFLVVKEAFHNIVKHSRASEVRVRVAMDAAQLLLTIEDNGRGFDPAQTPPGRKGNGLTNMRKRLEPHGGHLSLTSSPAHGTKIEIKTALSP